MPCINFLSRDILFSILSVSQQKCEMTTPTISKAYTESSRLLFGFSASSYGLYSLEFIDPPMAFLILIYYYSVFFLAFLIISFSLLS